ncbi:hypothetical protein C8A01DRAFT_34466 [Parachaetomium inaequale]|uniref:Uncharacterized protein n=1 Tax=Parachaetomium inaequale TaxID=2588326 RepID=A0AAN6PIC1_9PEZI|nr:hypothetical protein C8A01DRAFT_34466 [Parachaetomium inaequale]
MHLTQLTTALLLAALLGTLAAPRSDTLTTNPSSDSPVNPTTTPAPVPRQFRVTPRYVVPFISPELGSPNPNPQPDTNTNADAKEGGVGGGGGVHWIGARSSGGAYVVNPVTRQAAWVVYGLVLAPVVMAVLEAAVYFLG